jgi:tRNA A-37 threonylcarbamoyl transferase component Bud32
MSSPGPAPSAPTLEAGQILGRLYRVVRLVGRGAQGHVYEVEHLKLGTRFAAKLLHPHLAGDPAAIKRFQREAALASQLAHPAIARVVNFDQTEGGQYFAVMELLDGEDLGARLRRGPLRVGEALTLTEEIARALGVAHAAGVVHRDLKPSNLFLPNTTEGPRVKLTDFGISKFLEPPEDATRLTDTGAVVGTPLYMAPEQAAGEAIDHRVDVYALGVVLFEMLAARPPFRAKRAHQLIVEKTFMDSPDVQALLPGLPPALAAVLRKAIARRAQDRFQNMGELITALSDALARGGVDPDAILTTTELPPLSDQAFEQATLRGRRQGGALFVGLGALAGVAVAVGGYLALRPAAPAAVLAPPKVAAPASVTPPPALEPATGVADAAPTPAVTLTSAPPGAEVLDPAGAVAGATPLTVPLSAAGTWRVQLGARQATVALDPAVHGGQTVQVVLPPEPAPTPRASRGPRPRAPKRGGAPEPMDVVIE